MKTVIVGSAGLPKHVDKASSCVVLRFDSSSSRHPIFTDGYFDGPRGFDPYGRERLRSSHKGPVYHGGKIVKIKPVWKDDNGSFRIGRTGDMIQMFVDLNINDRAF